MDKTYRSKVDLWLLLLIDGVIIASVVPIGLSGDVLESIVLAALIGVPVSLYMFNIKYVIRDSSLIVKDGIFQHTYNINGIKSIKPTRTLLSSPAASLDRLEINFAHDRLIVSPKQKEEFIRHLCKVSENEIKVYEATH